MKREFRILASGMMGLVLLLFVGAVNAEEACAVKDWPMFRGPTGDGISPYVPETLAKTPKQLWKISLRASVYSGVAVSGDKVVVMDAKVDEADIVVCLSLSTGEELWTHEYENTGEPMDYGSAPRATPAIYDGMVYTLGARGQMLALSMDTGEVIWQKHMEEDFDGFTPIWGYCASPMVVDGKVIINPGGPEACFVALDPKTGETIWATEGDEANYASFLLMEIDGVKQLVNYDIDYLYAVSLKDGKILWKKEAPANAGYIVSDPVKAGEHLVLCTEDNSYMMSANPTPNDEGEVEEDWIAENGEFIMGNASPVALGDLVIGTSAGYGFMGLDASNNLETRWMYEEENVLKDFTSIIAGDGRALILDMQGKVHLAKFDKESVEIVAQAKLTGNTQSQPALTEKYFVVRDDNAVYCFRLTEEGE